MLYTFLFLGESKMAFSKFDKNLDKEIFSETIAFETSRITVGVFSYNDGEKKMQVSRENMSLAIWNHLLLTIPPTAGRLLVYGQILPFI